MSSSGSKDVDLREPRSPVKPTILIVDDTDGFREVLEDLVSALGYTPMAVDNGAAALEAMKVAHPDLVLLDIVMPGMDGHEVLEMMKKDAALRHLPVIIISGIHEIESAVRCIERGADDYLTKPFDPVLLKARIRSSLEKKQLRDQEVHYRQRIEKEKQRADELLHALFPAPVVQELKRSGEIRPKRHERVAVLFCDIVGFTEYCDSRAPEEVVAHLQEMVGLLEAIASQHGLEKLKTIGDAFMATCGLLDKCPSPVEPCVRAGIAMAEKVPELAARWQVRIGIHVGPVVAGVVGREKYLYDIWGDTVNTAFRVMQHGAAGGINLSREACIDTNAKFDVRSLGSISAKGKGEIQIFGVHTG